MRKAIKSLAFAIVALIMSTVFVGCENPSLQDLADEMNKDLPKDFGNGMVLKKAEINDNYFVFQVEGDEAVPEVSIMLVDEISKMASKELKDEMLQSEDMKEIYDQCKKEKKGMKMYLKGNRSGKTVILFDIKPEEM